MDKILVIDGNSIINRAFYGIRSLSTKSGKPTNAIYGMIAIISKQLENLKPKYCAVAFDLKAPTFRHKIFEHYKEGRHPTPPDLLAQFADAKECLRLMGIHVLELEGYEADDIQGTVASFANTVSDTESYILTGDRDLLQLIDDKISVLLATNKDTLTMREAEFFDKYGISPKQFVDMKALMGDSSDNIPGVSGIGEKTAASLIQNFGSLDEIYNNIEDSKISEGVRRKLISDKDNAYLSKKLAQINTQAPIGKNLSDLEYHGFDSDGLFHKFRELELFSFITKFGLSENSAPKIENDTPEHKEESFEVLTEEKLNTVTAQRVAVQYLNGEFYLYTSDGESFKYTSDALPFSEWLFKRDVIGYDLKTLCHTLRKIGAEPPGDRTKLYDIMLYGYVLNPGTDISVTTLASDHLSMLVNANSPMPKIYYLLEEKMRKAANDEGLTKVLDELEIPLVNILFEIEERGFKINCEKMFEFADALTELAEELKQKIYEQSGCEFNLNSPKQLGEVLFEKMGLPSKKKKTKSGYSTDAQTLEELRPYSPIIDDILEYRQVTKLHGTYAAALPKLADKNSRIHTDFKQALTATGRLSSADPNLQNIPVKTKLGREMRRYFEADDGYVLIDADYSQIELRLLAHISDDYNMCEAFREGEDIHRKTAAAVFGIPEEEVSEQMRKKAKAVNFGIVYGISGFSLAKDIGTTTQQATKYIKNYLHNYPNIDLYLENVVKDATEKGYTTTPMGRRRYIPELNSQNGIMRAFGKRVAMNAPIQGAAADIMKLAMIKVDRALKAKRLDAHIVMQVHDELVVEAKEEQKREAAEIIKREMESAAKLSIPLTVDVSSGKNWLVQEDI